MPDHQRPLAPRGRRDAPAVGHWLLLAGHLPGQVLCSSARRARETWQLAQAKIGPAVPARFEDSAYQATAAGLLGLIRQTPPEVATLLVIGHDPAIPELALMLAGDVAAAGRAGAPAERRERPDPLERMRIKFPTAAVAVLDLTGVTWPQLGPGQARLLEFVTARDISRWSSDGA
jgi:phosphohistidine phosphatase